MQSQPKQFIIPDDLDPQFHPPSNLQLDTFLNRNNKTVRFGYVFPEVKPNCVVFILQGLSEFGEKYSEFMNEQLSKGRACVFIDWVYQGGSERLPQNPHKRHSDGFESDAQDVLDFMANQLPEILSNNDAPDTPVILYGHSTGAAISLLALRNNPDITRGVALSAPLLKINFPEIAYPLLRLIASVQNKINPEKYVFFGENWDMTSKHNQFEGNVLTSDERRFWIQRQWFVENPDLQVGSVTWAWLNNAFKTTDFFRKDKELESLSVPFLIAGAGKDQLTKASEAEKLSKKLEHSEYLLFKDSQHEILMETDEIRRAYLDKFDTFIECCL